MTRKTYHLLIISLFIFGLFKTNTISCSFIENRIIIDIIANVITPGDTLVTLTNKVNAYCIKHYGSENAIVYKTIAFNNLLKDYPSLINVLENVMLRFPAESPVYETLESIKKEVIYKLRMDYVGLCIGVLFFVFLAIGHFFAVPIPVEETTSATVIANVTEFPT